MTAVPVHRRLQALAVVHPAPPVANDNAALQLRRRAAHFAASLAVCVVFFGGVIAALGSLPQ